MEFWIFECYYLVKDFSAKYFFGEMYPKSALNFAFYDNHNENICLAPLNTFWNFFLSTYLRL
jgi:hypothetical protein